MPGTGSFFHRRIRPYLIPRSLSARVLWLTVEIILLVEIVILMPSLGRERETWLWDRVTDAHLAVYSEATEAKAIQGGMLDSQTQQYLLRLSGTEAIKLVQSGSVATLMPADANLQIAGTINLDNETILGSMWQADLAVLGLKDGNQMVEAVSPLDKSMQVQVVIDGAALASHLRIYVGHIAMLSVVIALVTGLLVFAALDRRLVRPMRILTASIVGFRKDPARAGLTSLEWLSSRSNDEVAVAARELAAMQDELRAALWRNARLAAVGTEVAKISHDLRNILTSALLVADRLQETADPVVRRAANTLIPAVERAAELVSRTVDFAREGPPAITVGPVVLRELADEAVNMVRSADPVVTIENLIPGSLILPLDRTQIYRVLVNLIRNAIEASASRITLSTEMQGGLVQLVVADNGPGLPKKVLDKLFQPFTGTGRRGGTGLGLAIARDLIRAHGGDLTLRSTGSHGTVFVMGLAIAEEPVS
ncbi:MAG TPA: HAMP domain-containing sensor histidine kinase [Acidocella sp.]|nr:MAG: hypothetical protein B7Z77_00735 [Acidocella sp. 20-58-15]HQT37844.1 HAMP domain-containing sensor histidine kinase [Acidocella sp.]